MTQSEINKKLKASIKDKGGPKYSLIQQINNSIFKGKRKADAPARTFLTESLKTGGKILPGQLIMFNYFEPATKEELEYYDAQPVTIFFNVVDTEQGKRYLGFNIHYYPPKMRKLIMDKIFEIFKPVYSKYFKTGLQKEMDAIDYNYLMDSLKKAKLDFGVRMYIPKLCTMPTVIPPAYWHIAVYTEGNFRKQTRQAIMNYWKNFRSNYKG